MKPDLSAVFEEEPDQWGLRGDPFLWAELKEECKGKELPYHEDFIVEMVCKKFEAVSGVPLTYNAKPYVAKYAHGGMSSGHLSGLFWIGRGMAKILENYHNVDEVTGKKKQFRKTENAVDSFNDLLELTTEGTDDEIFIPIGFDRHNQVFLQDITQIPHMLICGISGAGKTAFLQTLLVLAAKQYSKQNQKEIKYIICSSRMEYSIFQNTTQLYVPIVVDPRKGVGAVQWTVVEMLKRYRVFSESGVRDLKSYNRSSEEKLPEFFIVVDDLYDLLSEGKDDLVENLSRLLQMGRNAGIHCILVTSLVSDNNLKQKLLPLIPCRICFTMASEAESKAVIGMKNAAELQFPGEIIFKDISNLKKLKSVHVSYDELKCELEPFKMKPKDFVLTEWVDPPKGDPIPMRFDTSNNGESLGEYDELLPESVETVLEMGSCSVAMLQRRLKVSYSRAARIVDQMEELGIIGQYEGAKPRSVLMNRSEWEKLADSLGMDRTTGSEPS